MDKVKDLRIERGLSQAALAAEVGISKQMICAIERGRKQPSLDVLRKLAATLCVPVDALI